MIATSRPTATTNHGPGEDQKAAARHQLFVILLMKLEGQLKALVHNPEGLLLEASLRRTETISMMASKFL